MIQLPKNCKVQYLNDGVQVSMTYATTLPVGVHDGVKVFNSGGYMDVNGRRVKEKRYLNFTFTVPYQHNMPMVLRDKYYEYKKKAMLFNRMKKKDQLEREINVLVPSNVPGRWLFSEI